MTKTKNPEQLSSKNLSLINMLIEACKNNYENSFASDTQAVLETIKDNEEKILAFLADIE